MSDTTPNDKSAGVRPDYIRLGVDTHDATHWYRTGDETIFVIRDTNGAIEHREDLSDRHVDDWMAFVSRLDDRGWQTRDYGIPMHDRLADSLNTDS
jgi:hypothetical protein